MAIGLMLLGIRWLVYFMMLSSKYYCENNNGNGWKNAGYCGVLFQCAQNEVLRSRVRK
jgi:hypothetical protein